jgi:hypothetical protein
METFNFLETSGLKAVKTFDNDSNYLSFFVTKENFQAIRVYLKRGREMVPKNLNRKYYRLFSPAKDIMCRFKRKTDDENDIFTDVVFVKIMRETSKSGNKYLKIDFANTFGALATHEILFRLKADKDPETFIFKCEWKCTKIFVQDKLKRNRRRN